MIEFLELISRTPLEVAWLVSILVWISGNGIMFLYERFINDEMVSIAIVIAGPISSVVSLLALLIQFNSGTAVSYGETMLTYSPNVVVWSLMLTLFPLFIMSLSSVVSYFGDLSIKIKMRFAK